MPVLRFHLLDLYYATVAGGFTVTCTTNAACHLYLRYSENFPWIHRKPIERRGLVIGWDAMYCFTAYHHIEQNEAGDTFTHTFTWPGWKECERRYFYFWGTMGGQDMVSDTPIFWLHYTTVPEPLIAYFYPDPAPETTSVDGEVRHYVLATAGFGIDWATLVAGPGTEALDHLNIGYAPYIVAHQDDQKWRWLTRGIQLYDTHPLGAGSSLVSATLRLYGFWKGDGFSPKIFPDINVYSSNPASNTALTAADYATLGTTPFCNTPISYADWRSRLGGDDPTWNEFEFNAAGLAAISKTGITKLGLRNANYDVAGIAPVWTSQKVAQISFYNAEQSPETRPRLAVSYYP